MGAQETDGASRTVKDDNSSRSEASPLSLSVFLKKIGRIYGSAHVTKHVAQVLSYHWMVAKGKK